MIDLHPRYHGDEGRPGLRPVETWERNVPGIGGVRAIALVSEIPPDL